MAKYIATIQDGEGNDVYPQTKPEAVIGLDQKIKESITDTGLIGTGITFVNGAYDWGTKQGKGQYSAYRVLSTDKANIVFLSLDIGISNDVTKSTVYVKLPAKASLPGNNFFSGYPAQTQWKLNDDQEIKINVIGTSEPVAKNSRLQLRTMFITDNKQEG